MGQLVDREILAYLKCFHSQFKSGDIWTPEPGVKKNVHVVWY